MRTIATICLLVYLGLSAAQAETGADDQEPLAKISLSLIINEETVKAEIPVSVEKPGKCPRISLPRCTQECSSDSQCMGDLKCCPYSCGNVCWPPAAADATLEEPNPESYDYEQAQNQQPLGMAQQADEAMGIIPQQETDEETPLQIKPENGGVIQMTLIEPAEQHRPACCKSTGPRCVSDCTGMKDGDYQSCRGCDVYVSCVGGLRYDDRPCAAGGLVWDDNKKRCEYNSSTCHGCTCPPPCHGTGPTCRTSCYGLSDGYYQSCSSCHLFNVCWNHRLSRQRCFPLGTVWDDFKKSCQWYSNTCHKPHN